MYSRDQRDLFYETAQFLKFNDLRNFCQSNQTNRSLCQDIRIQQLIQKRYNEMMIENKVEYVINQFNTVNLGRAFSIEFLIHEDQKERHTLLIDRDYTNGFVISEQLQNINYTYSILYIYIKTLLNFKGLENFTQIDVVDFLNNYNVNGQNLSADTIDYYLNLTPFDLIGLVESYANNLMYNKYKLNNRVPMFDLVHRSTKNLKFRIMSPTQKELKEILTLMYTLYRNTTILREW